VSAPAASGWRRLELHGTAVTDQSCQALSESALASSGAEVMLYYTAITARGRAILGDAFGERHRVY
jgi:hypothetical protein